MVAFQWKSLQIMYTYLSIITILLPRVETFPSYTIKFFLVLSWSNKAPFCYVRWIVPKCVPTNIVLIRYFRVWKGIFGIRDLPKIRCGNRERDKYIDRIRDLTVPREARLVKNCAQDADFVSRECRKPSRPTGSSGQSKLTRRALSGVCFQTKHPMGCLVNRS